MDVVEARREVRRTFRGGFAGHLVSGILWLASAGLATWVSPRAGIILLVVGGFFIFPMTQIVLRALGGPASLAQDHSINGLGMQFRDASRRRVPVVPARQRPAMDLSQEAA